MKRGDRCITKRDIYVIRFNQANTFIFVIRAFRVKIWISSEIINELKILVA